MRLRSLFPFMLILCAALVWAKPNKQNEWKTMTAKSDALYYMPSLLGVNDLAVTVTIPRLADNPLAKQALITFYYASKEQRWVSVAHLPDQAAQARSELTELVAPLGDYLVPRPALTTFDGMDVKVQEVSRQLEDLPGTVYYQLIGKTTDPASEVKEYHILLDKAGLAHEIETVLKSGEKMTARIDNIRNGERWQISKVTTRIMSKVGDQVVPQWRIDNIEYGAVDGYSLPVKITSAYRDSMNLPIKGLDDFTFIFSDYRINKGEATAALAHGQGPVIAPPPPVKPLVDIPTTK